MSNCDSEMCQFSGNCCVFIIVKYTTNNFLGEAKQGMTGSRKIFSNLQTPRINQVFFFFGRGNLKYMTQDKHRLSPLNMKGCCLFLSHLLDYLMERIIL